MTSLWVSARAAGAESDSSQGSGAGGQVWFAWPPVGGWQEIGAPGRARGAAWGQAVAVLQSPSLVLGPQHARALWKASASLPEAGAAGQAWWDVEGPPGHKGDSPTQIQVLEVEAAAGSKITPRTPDPQEAGQWMPPGGQHERGTSQEPAGAARCEIRGPGVRSSAAGVEDEVEWGEALSGGSRGASGGWEELRLQAQGNQN